MRQVYINGKRVDRMPKLEDGKWYSIAIVTKPGREKK